MVGSAKVIRLAAFGPWLLALASLSASKNVPPAGPAEYHRFAAPAAWVAPIEPDSEGAPPAENADASAWVQLFDRQIEIGPAGDDRYLHFAVKVLNSVGVGEYSQINLVVDPGFQTLDIHRLRIVRGGVIIDQRRLAHITELPQETERRNRVYNGRTNVNIELADVRAGDVIEYAYTVHSREPSFPGHFFARLDTGWTVPVRRQRIRVLAPLARRLSYRSGDGSPLPAPLKVGDRSEFVIEWNDSPPLTVPDWTPGWYSPWPCLEVADDCSWADVVRMVEPFYRRPSGTGPRVAAALEAIRGAGGTPADQALRALQYVQEEIRYTSIAIGQGAYQPAPPELVMERRFGDCKDKSLLLATLLDRLGVEARAALVHSARGRALDGSPPTPYAFDHVIVRAVIDGGVYWLDPTAATQYGPLSSSRHPDYERALPVDPATAGLEAIPLPASDMYSKEITSRLDLSAGLEAEGTLTVTTRFEGPLADVMRPTLSRGTAEQRRADYESYTARYYPGARSLAPVEIRDDKERNALTVKESYRLEKAFAPNDDGVLELALHADELYSYAEALGVGARRAPLALEYPIKVRQRVIARLPEDWPVKAETVTVDNPAFRYRSRVDYADRTLTLDYQYEALASSVAPEDIERFEADRARVFADLGYVLTYPGAARGGADARGVSPVPMLALIFTFLLALWAAARWGYRYDPLAKVPTANAPAGIGGWLLLPALSTIVMTFMAGVVLISWLPYVEAGLWHRLPSVVNSAHAGSARLAVLLILAFVSLQVVVSGLTAVLFFKKRTSAPLFFVSVAWSSLVIGSAVGAWKVAAGISKEIGNDFGRGIGAALLWTCYMLVSQRVKATFTRRLSPGKASHPPGAGDMPVG